MITFDNVTKVHPNGTTAVKDLNLTVEEGSITVFVGPSGCGKTTSLRMINKMTDPSEGRVIVNGEDIADVDPVSHRLGIGYVIQHAGLLPHRSVLDNVAQVLRLKKVPKDKARAAARDAIERVRLAPELADRYPAQLSGGQQQRVGVARALGADPPILLMDEPFSAVDPVTRDDLQNEVLRIQKDLKKTVVIVTHDIDEALRLGDKIAVFARGGVVQQYAAPETLLTRPANEEVEQFIGRDRGFRALSFQPALRFPDGREISVEPLGEAADGARQAPEGWRLAVGADGSAESWVAEDGDTFPVGTVASLEGGSLRSTLDSVLSSPGPFGLVVDGEDRPVGTVASQDVFELVDDKAGVR